MGIIDTEVVMRMSSTVHQSLDQVMAAALSYGRAIDDRYKVPTSEDVSATRESLLEAAANHHRLIDSYAELQWRA